MSTTRLLLDEDVWPGLAILAHNTRDFVPLAVACFFEGHAHAGVILSPQIDRGEMLRRTLNLLRTLPAEEIADTVRFLADYR